MNESKGIGLLMCVKVMRFPKERRNVLCKNLSLVTYTHQEIMNISNFVRSRPASCHSKIRRGAGSQTLLATK